MHLSLLVPVTLVTIVLGASFSPMAEAQRSAPAPNPLGAATAAVGVPRVGSGILPVVAPVLLGHALTSSQPAGTLAAAAGLGNFIAVSTGGDAKNESTDPMRQRFTFPLYSLVDGSLVGSATDDVACSSSTPPPCAVVDAITNFRSIQGMFPWGRSSTTPK
jgi:hypothetical protein